MKIAICVPVSRLLDQRASFAQTHAVVDAASHGHQVELMVEGNHERPLPIVEARNRLSIRAMEHGADYLLWIDSDATAEPGMLTRLLSRDVPIVSALCFKRKYPVTPACGRKDTSPGAGMMDYPAPITAVAKWVDAHDGLGNETGSVLLPDEQSPLLAVDVVGTHYTLIKREVFEATPQPWYVRTTAPTSGSTGSDWYFCKQAKEAGFASFVDLTAISGHLEGSHCISVHDFVAWTIVSNWADYQKQRGE